MCLAVTVLLKAPMGRADLAKEVLADANFQMPNDIQQRSGFLSALIPIP